MIESNKLMAKFLGCFQDDKGFWGFKDTPVYQRWHSDRFLEFTHYDIDWNWLMQVVEKIESLKIDVSIYEKQCEIRDNFFEQVHINICHQTKIQAVYSACLQFIQNENTLGLS